LLNATTRMPSVRKSPNLVSETTRERAEA